MIRNRPSRLIALGGAVAAVTLVLAGCSTANKAAGAGGDSSSLDAVYKQVDGLSLKDRDAKLLELAKKEGGTVDLYAGTKPEDTDPIIKAFTKKYGIKVKNYRADGEVIAQKVLQEAQAGHAGADLYVADASQGSVLQDQGVLAKLKTPLTKQLVPGSVTDYTAALYVIAPMISWNTNLVKDPPKSLEDVFTRFKGKFMIEQEDAPWFEAMVKDYLEKQKGMSEDQAIKYFEDAMPGAMVVKGHTLMTTLLTSGQAEVCLSCYYHEIYSAAKDGAHVAATPIDQPVPYTFISAGIPTTVQHPATALLLLDFMLTDAQKMFVEQGRNPSNVDYEGNFKLENYKNFPYAITNDPKDLTQWQRTYEKVLAKAGGKVIDK